MKLCLGYNAVMLIGQQKIFIIKKHYVTSSELSKLFRVAEDTQYKNLSNGELVPSNSLVLLDNKKITFDIHDNASGG